MSTVERTIVLKHTIDGDDEVVRVPEYYPTDAVVFLHFDPSTRAFMFEQRTNKEDVLYGKTVIPGGKIQDPGELGTPLWALRSEQMEECGIVPETVVYLGEDGEAGRVRLFCFLTVGTLYGELTNREPDKHKLIWLPEEEVFHNGDIKINPIFELGTTQRILMRAHKEMVRLGI